MSDPKSPQAVAAEYHRVIDAYRTKRRQGAAHHQAFLAALDAYSRYHPDVSRPAASHAVSRMMRALDQKRAA